MFYDFAMEAQIMYYPAFSSLNAQGCGKSFLQLIFIELCKHFFFKFLKNNKAFHP